MLVCRGRRDGGCDCAGGDHWLCAGQSDVHSVEVGRTAANRFFCGAAGAAGVVLHHLQQWPVGAVNDK